MLLETNLYAKVFRHVGEVQQSQQPQTVSLRLKEDLTKDKNRYNLPKEGNFAVIIPGSGDDHQQYGRRDVVIYVKNTESKGYHSYW